MAGFFVSSIPNTFTGNRPNNEMPFSKKMVEVSVFFEFFK
jgi:hypothetical protein